MAARQEVRLKEAEAADQTSTANRDTFAEPTERIMACGVAKSRAKPRNKRTNPAIAALVISSRGCDSVQSANRA